MNGNFPQITRVVLDKLKDNPDSPAHPLPDGSRRTFSHTNKEQQDDYFWGSLDNMMNPCSYSYNDDGAGASADYFFQVAREEGVIYLCLSDDVSGKRHKVNFSFLDELRLKFRSKYSAQQIKRANAYAMDKAFTPKIRIMMHDVNTNISAGTAKTVAALSSKIEDLKNVMGQNVNLILKREDNIQILLEKCEEAEEDIAVFAKKSKDLKNMKKKDSQTTSLVLVMIVVFIIYLLCASQCGFTLGKCKRSSGSNS